MEQQNSETPTITTRSAGMRYGLMLGGVSIVYFLVLSLTGTDAQGPASYVSYVFIAGAIFLAHKYYKENGNGYMSFGQGVGIGFWTGFISSILSSVFMYVYIKFIDSGFVDAIKEKQMQEMEKQNMSPEQMEQALKFAGYFTTPEAIVIFGIIGGIIAGLIIGLIVSIFTKNANPEAEI